jgi:hypothetical protein
MTIPPLIPATTTEPNQALHRACLVQVLQRLEARVHFPAAVLGLGVEVDVAVELVLR